MKAYNDPTADKAIANLRYYRPLAYLCFPFERDWEKVKRYCRLAAEKNYTPIAAQLMYPAAYPDYRTDAKQRKLAMGMRLELVRRCQELWVIGDKVTGGMQQEIDCAREMRITVKHLAEDTQTDISRRRQ